MTELEFSQLNPDHQTVVAAFFFLINAALSTWRSLDNRWFCPSQHTSPGAQASTFSILDPCCTNTNALRKSTFTYMCDNLLPTRAFIIM